MIRLENLHLAFAGRKILSQCSFDFPESKISVLLGPSGCGKSTLLRILAGLIPVDSGQMRVDQQNIALVFQEPRLLAWLNIEENVLLPFRLGQSGKISPENILRQMGLWEYRQLFPHELSGGMKMRASIARALITRPNLLLMDEPFAALDEVTRFALQDLLLEIHRQRPMSVVFVTHSFSEAVYLGERIFLMSPQGGHTVLQRELNFAARDFDLRSSASYLSEIQILAKALRQESAKPV